MVGSIRGHERLWQFQRGHKARNPEQRQESEQPTPRPQLQQRRAESRREDRSQRENHHDDGQRLSQCLACVQITNDRPCDHDTS